MQLVAVVVDGTSQTAVQGHTKLVLEERSLDDDNDENKKESGNGWTKLMKGGSNHIRRNCEPETMRNSKCKDLSQVPTIRHLTSQDTVDRERHDRTIVEQGR